MKPFRTLIAVLVAVGIPFAGMIAYRTRQSTGFASIELILYPLLFGGLGIGVILLLKRFFLGNAIEDFNTTKGNLGADILWGSGLTVAYFVLFQLERFTLSDILASTPNVELLDLMLDMREHPWMVLVWFGPVLWIGIALYEELTRAFLLNGLWSYSKHPGWVAFAILVSAVLIGLVHWSQGPYGIVTVAIKSAVAGAFYHKVRRLLPLIVAHVLYDGVQVAALLITYPR